MCRTSGTSDINEWCLSDRASKLRFELEFGSVHSTSNVERNKKAGKNKQKTQINYKENQL